MWKTLNINDKLYLFGLECNENKLIVILTDLLLIWECEITAENLEFDFKVNNPHIEATQDQITNDFLKIVQNLHNMKITIRENEDKTVNIIIKRSCNDLSEFVKSEQIEYKFTLNEKCQEQFKKKFSVSAIQTIYYLEKEQRMLLSMIQKKDRELEEYRMEKGEISRDELKSEKFDSKMMNDTDTSLFLNVFTTKEGEDFWKKFSMENGEVKTLALGVETEPWNTRPRKRIIHSSRKVVKRGSGLKMKKIS